MTSPDAEPTPSLESILSRINRDVADWSGSPAKTADDRAVTGDFPLHKVAIWGDVPAAAVLLDHGADINCQGEDDDTPLHRAIAGGQREMAAFLLERGADADQQNMYGQSSRDDAAIGGDDALMRLLERF